jgi:hypothetical protein
MCKSRLSDYDLSKPIAVRPMKTFPIIRDLVTDVSWNFEVNKRIPPFRPREGVEFRMDQRVHGITLLPERHALAPAEGNVEVPGGVVVRRRRQVLPAQLGDAADAGRRDPGQRGDLRRPVMAFGLRHLDCLEELLRHQRACLVLWRRALAAVARAASFQTVDELSRTGEARAYWSRRLKAPDRRPTVRSAVVQAQWRSCWSAATASTRAVGRGSGSSCGWSWR